jgi:hypothetical protein
MTDNDFARTGVDPVGRCTLGCGAAVAAEGQVEHRRWHAEIARLAFGLERLRERHRPDYVAVPDPA